MKLQVTALFVGSDKGAGVGGRRPVGPVAIRITSDPVSDPVSAGRATLRRGPVRARHTLAGPTSSPPPVEVGLRHPSGYPSSESGRQWGQASMPSVRARRATSRGGLSRASSPQLRTQGLVLGMGARALQGAYLF